MNIHKNTPDGDGSDVLVFLTGQDEIEDLASLLKRHVEDLKSDDSADQNFKGDIVQNIKGVGTSINSGHSLIANGVLICGYVLFLLVVIRGNNRSYHLLLYRENSALMWADRSLMKKQHFSSAIPQET